MLNYIRKVSYILSTQENHKIKLGIIFFLFTVVSFMEAIGIGLIGPFLTIASSPENISQESSTYYIITYLGISNLNHSELVLIAGASVVAFFCAKLICSVFIKFYTFHFVFERQKELSIRLFRSYLSAPYEFHIGRNTSAVVRNIVIETTNFSKGSLKALLDIAANLSIVVVLLLMLAKVSLSLLSLVLLVFMPVLFLFQVTRGKLKVWGKSVSRAKQEIIKIINHALGGIKETKVFMVEDFFEKQILEQSFKHFSSLSKFESFKILPKLLLETTLVFSVVSYIIVALLIFRNGFQEVASVLGVFTIAALRLLPSTTQTIFSLSLIQNSHYAVDKLYLDLKELEKFESCLKNGKVCLDKGAASVRKIEGKEIILNRSTQEFDALIFQNKIEIKDLSYRYPGSNEQAISDIDLQIYRGESIGLIGKSGSGKTTLTDLMLGLLSPISGDISVDDRSIYENIHAWRNLVAYIPQAIFLMDDSLEKNIAFGVDKELIDTERLHYAIRMAQLSELVSHLPQGMETQIGERGVRLSGGQRQRIGIARALYHKREVFIFDEATSALDGETESAISESIESLCGEKTLISIAHRISTLRHCNRIYELGNGCIQRVCRFEDLFQIGSR